MAMAYALLLPLLMILAAPFGVYGEKYSFPGKELANAITLRWNDAVKSPLRIVCGGYLAPDSIAFHAPDHPSVLQHLNFVMSPWINRQDIRKHGMAIVCLQKDTLCRRNAQSQFKLDNWQSLQVGGSAKRFSHSREERFLFVFISPIPDKAL